MKHSVLKTMLLAAALCTGLTACGSVTGTGTLPVSTTTTPPADTTTTAETTTSAGSDLTETTTETAASAAEETPTAPTETTAAMETTTTTTTASKPRDPETEEERRAVFREYFLANYSMNDLVGLFDVTHDGKCEMIVLHNQDEWWEGKIYRLDGRNVREIYAFEGSDSHAGGFFNLYVFMNPGGTNNLGIERFNMYQGIGNTSLEIFYLDGKGGTIAVEEINSDNYRGSESPMITDEEMAMYRRALNEKIIIAYKMYASFSESTVMPMGLPTDPHDVLGI